jgi:hypothetical protein
MWNLSLIDGPVHVPDVFGYHLNIAPSVYTDALEPYVMTPSLPRRVFAGAETVFLKFADEAEARSVLGAYWMEPTE